MAVDARSFGLIPPQTQGIAQGLGRGLATQAAFQQVGQQNIAAQREAQVRQALSGVRTPEFASQTQQQKMLAEQTAGLGGALAQAEQPSPVMTQEEKIQAAQNIDPATANTILKQMGLDDASKRAEMSRFAADLENTPFDMRREKIEARIQKLRAEGRDPTQTEKLLDLNEADQNKGLLGIQLMDLKTKERLDVRERAAREAEIPAGQREFEALTAGLTKEQEKEAKLIKLGLSPRAVGSAIQTISDEGITDQIADAEAVIAQRKKFAEMTGSSRAKTIDQGFERIQKIDQGINTIDRAISALEGGARTGAIQRFAPSITAASVELDQIRNQFALDVIGSVTLGAISEAELDLAKQTGLPTGLDEPALIKHLEDRKAAQQKLRNYFQEQINHLDQGGTVASFLRSKERERPAEQTVPRETIDQQTPRRVQDMTTEELQAELARMRGAQ